jgi:hypothetical protein
MPQPKLYESAAQRQQAYRARKKEEAVNAVKTEPMHQGAAEAIVACPPENEERLSFPSRCCGDNIRGMVADLIACPHCHQSETVIRFGTNESGSARCRCKDCNKTFTPKPNSRKTTPETEAKIERALQERLSIEATARLLQVAKKTIYKTLKKTNQPA